MPPKFNKPPEPPTQLPTPSRTPLQAYCDRWGKGCGAELCVKARNVCLMRGTAIPAPLLFVGEAPGESEDTIGMPLVGPAGHVFDGIVDRAVPSEVAWVATNLLGCIPRDPANNDKADKPLPEDVRQCAPRLRAFVELVQPKLIVCVGTTARDYLDSKFAGNVWELSPDEKRYKTGRERQRSPLATIPQVWVHHPSYILHIPYAHQDSAILKCVATIATAIDEHILGEVGGLL